MQLVKNILERKAKYRERDGRFAQRKNGKVARVMKVIGGAAQVAISQTERFSCLTRISVYISYSAVLDIDLYFLVDSEEKPIGMA